MKWISPFALAACLLAALACPSELRGQAEPASPEAAAAENEVEAAPAGDDPAAPDAEPADDELPEFIPEPPSFMLRFERRVDKIAGWFVEKLAAVMFYEIVGRKEIELTVDEPIRTVEDVRPLVERARQAGLDPLELDYTLSLPPNSMTDKQAAEFQKALNDEQAGLTAGRTKKFSVTVRPEPEVESEDPGTTRFTAARSGIPVVVLWLVLGATFFTVRMGFINFRGFKHAVDVTRGRYDDPDDEGEVTHFQALTAALSATVGLGNIAGVAIAVTAGGPGATFWMIVAGLLGMSSKFAECTLGQMYRSVRTDGRIMGGAMYYLQNGLAEMKMARFGKFLGVLFAVLCVFASFGGGNAFQVNQSLNAVQETVPGLDQYRWVYGLIMAALVAVVIIGGIRRIAATAERIVPLMCGVYVLACLWILAMNASLLPWAFGVIFEEAFTPRAGYGAFLGVLVMGFRRAAFSNEAGVGSAAIAHSAARTEHPAREGIVALLEPFIDTVVVCTMTALVIVVTQFYDAEARPEYAELIRSDNGAGLTSNAMGSQISWFPYVLSVAVVLFAYSTMISWSYYGERCWSYLFGDRASMSYRIVFVAFVFLGSVMSAENVLSLSDLMILGMAFPNILGVVLLSGKVKRSLDDYWRRYRSGEFEIDPGEGDAG